MPNTLKEDVLQTLVQQGAIAAEAVEGVRAQVARGTPLRDVLINQKLVDDETYTQVQAGLLGIPYINLRAVTIPDDVLRIIPETTAREHTIIAYQQSDRGLFVAMANPADRQIIDFIQKKVNMPIVVALASPSSIRAGVTRYQVSLETELQNILATAGQLSVTAGDDLTKAAEDLPVVRVTDLVLKHAILQDASDIHIEPTESAVIIRYRVDGILHDRITLPKEFLPGLVARIKVLSSLKIDEHRLPQDGRFKVEADDYRVAFRVSILPVYDGEKVVMRLLDESGRGLTLDDVGMRERSLEIFRKNIRKPHGMILVTGPTGSGKTTTLYAAMKELNTTAVNISTIEDPIEYRMPRINQTQVNPQIGLTFSNGLRSLVRQDPDIIMVGEIRDEETASLAVNAALTGHLVMSTLHTNSAAGALPRLLDMGIEAFLVASTTNLLLAQRLVRRLCEQCRQARPFDEARLADIAKIMNTDRLLATLQREQATKRESGWGEITIYEPVGCSACHDGYRGRIGIYELLELTDDLRPLITPTITSQQLEEAAREQQQMVTMIEDGFLKVIAGVTSIPEVLRVAKE